MNKELQDTVNMAKKFGLPQDWIDENIDILQPKKKDTLFNIKELLFLQMDLENNIHNATVCTDCKFRIHLMDKIKKIIRQKEPTIAFMFEYGDRTLILRV